MNIYAAKVRLTICNLKNGRLGCGQQRRGGEIWKSVCHNEKRSMRQLNAIPGPWASIVCEDTKQKKSGEAVGRREMRTKIGMKRKGDIDRNLEPRQIGTKGK